MCWMAWSAAWPCSAGRCCKGPHWLNRNTRQGFRGKNIAAHYDLGNELFEQFLDPTMMYSACSRAPTATLEQAQLNKLSSASAEARPQARRPPAGNRHRLGQHGPVCRQPLWLP